MASILVVEDDPGIRSALVRALTERGHVVSSESHGMAGLHAAVENRPDLVLLDLGLPDIDGLQVLAMLRAVSEVPVVVITARDEGPDVIKALDGGADDYVPKPFGVDQVEARVRAVLRRANRVTAPAAITIGGLTIDERTRQVTLDGQPIDLSRREFDLLLALAARTGEVVSKRQLIAEVWHQPYGGGDRTIDVHLSWLRRKLGETAAAPKYLHSSRGVGVRLCTLDDLGPTP
jgi:DNA-binding response OmpR family regulator